MTPNNKKPGAFRQPGKVNSPRKRTRTTAAQRVIHRRIAAQSEHSMKSGRPYWLPADYPELYALVAAAQSAAWSRRRHHGRIVFSFEGQAYAARFTSLDRIIVECRITGRFIASSGFFAL